MCCGGRADDTTLRQAGEHDVSPLHRAAGMARYKANIKQHAKPHSHRRAIFETHRDGKADVGKTYEVNERVDQRRENRLEGSKYHVDYRSKQVLDEACGCQTGTYAGWGLLGSMQNTPSGMPGNKCQFPQEVNGTI